MEQSFQEITVFPWLHISEPATVCGVEFLPRAVAIERAGDKGPHVAGATSYFTRGYIIRDTLDDPIKLDYVTPSIVFPSETNTSERIEIATRVFAFSSIVENNSIFYANSTVFEHFTQRIGGAPDGYARKTRRMHGSLLDGSLIPNVLETKPAWCGKYTSHNKELAQALSSIIFDLKAQPLRDALQALMGALTDADTIDSELERSLFARAAERLLHREGDTRNGRPQIQEKRGLELLKPLLENAGLDAQKPCIIDAWKAARRVRNAFWHPEDDAGPQFPFEKQTVVHPNLITFRMIHAIIIATLFDFGAIANPSKLADNVPVIEKWLCSIIENDARDPQEAANLGKFILRQGIQNCVTEWIKRYPTNDSFPEDNSELVTS
jgi:hypothetical protein